MSVDEVRILGIAEIAQTLSVERATVDTWRHRGILPAPDFAVSGRPAWHWSTIVAWAQATGRL